MANPFLQAIRRALCEAPSPSNPLGHPYLAQAFFALTFVPSETVEGLRGDPRWRVYYPAAWDADPPYAEFQAIGVDLYRITLHLLRKHAERGQWKDATRWAWATALECNDDLQAEGLPLRETDPLPEDAGLPPNQLAEQYYDAEADPPPLDLPALTQMAGSTANPGPGTNQPNPDKPENAEPPPDPAEAPWDAGSCADGQPRPWDLADTDATDIPGVAPEEAETLRQQVAADLEAYIKTRGTLPDHLRRFVQATQHPQVPWQRVLRHRLRQILGYTQGMVDYTYRRPNRRQAALRTVVLPSFYAPEQQVALIVDTSGSMGSRELNAALSEVRGILRMTGVRVTVLAVDAAVHTCQRVFRVENIQLLGGGGTDMGAGLAAVNDLRPKATCAVILTDGETPWPKDPPPFPVVVGLIETGWAPPDPPSWATTVRIPVGRGRSSV